MVAVGEWWWVPDEEQCFVPARVTSINGADASLDADGAPVSCPTAKLTTKIDSPDLLDAQLDDLVQMDQVNHPAIIDTLRRRYRSDKIYTGIADILVAMNPFKWLPVYTPAHVTEYAKGDQEAPAKPGPGHLMLMAPALLFGAAEATAKLLTNDDQSKGSWVSDFKAQSCRAADAVTPVGGFLLKRGMENKA